MMGGMDISTALAEKALEGIRISAAVVAKARRLVDQDRVTHIKGLVYEVQGDTDTYTVHLSYPEEVTGACNCLSALARCSHILAATILYLADPPPFTSRVPSSDPFEGIN